MKVRQGDTVQVIAGKEKGKQGKVERISIAQQRIYIQGVNLVIRHVKPRPDIRQAGRVQKEASINISNVMLVCNKCGKPTRSRSKQLENGKKVRQCLKCLEMID